MPEAVTIADNLWMLRYPLKLVGCSLGRNVTVIRLSTGQLVVHSTAPFTQEDISRILSWGEPAWLVDSTNFHDTCADLGRAAFPDIPYLIPSGFPKATGRLEHSILPCPEEWGDELQVVELAGMPKLNEHVFFHAPSRTLILSDLLFNLGEDAGKWTTFFFRVVSGMSGYPNQSRLFRSMIRDPDAFRRTLDIMMEWDFERVIVAHGEPITVDAKEIVRTILQEKGQLD